MGEGACVILADIDQRSLDETVAEFHKAFGRDAAIGVIMFTASSVDLDADSQQLEFTLLRKPVQLDGLKSAVGHALKGRPRGASLAFL